MTLVVMAGLTGHLGVAPKGGDPVAAGEGFREIKIVGVVVQKHKFEGLGNLTTAEIRYIMIVSRVYPACGAERHIGKAVSYHRSGLGAAITVRSLEPFQINRRQRSKAFLVKNAAYVD